MPSSTRAVVFDLDGVLVYSGELHWKAYREAFRSVGRDFPLEEYIQLGIGAAREEVIEDVLGKLPAAELERLMALKESALRRSLESDTVPTVPGVIDFLDDVDRRGWKTAVASAGRTPQLLLDAAGLGRRFPLVLGRTSATQSKPDPEIYLTAASKLGVRPEECLAVEDSPKGVGAALAAGMRVLALATTHPAEQLRDAHAVFRRYAEIRLDDWA